MPLEVIRRRLQPMVDVDGDDLPRPFLGASDQKRGGIGPTAVGYSKGKLRGKSGNRLANRVACRVPNRLGHKDAPTHSVG